ncbi:MAG TPA: ATP-binding protein [Candidatus Dormibacteraeota bacterium]|nr:ATP-binding protein [Candidatus Dormibacteraeota bacterium]HEV2477444.1 ATP-binding protein [Candidatus Dormibacteraeota bacterium]
MRRLRSLATGITSVSLIVAFVAIAVIAAGVLGVSQSTFDRLMVQAGASAVDAQAMFDQGVTTIFLAAVLIAVTISVALAVVLAAWLSRPLRQMARAAERIAGGDYTTRVPGSGPNELASLAESFNRMAQSLADQERQRADFIANAAHELRTPLTNLQGYLEALRDGVIAPTPEQFRSLHEEAQRLVRLSRSLEALAVNQRAEGAVPRENVDVAKAIRSAYEVARPAFEAKAIEVDMTVPDGLLARAEPDDLAQVLANLLQNASRYTPHGGRAAIRASGRRSRVLVAVSNTGDGIPDADLPHVFDRFYRVEKSRDAARGGAGIGLAIVKQLVEASGGRVGADSDGRLTRVWFSLPAA